MTLTAGRSTHYPPHVYSVPLQRFVTHSNKNCPVSESFFAHPLKCCSSSFYITWSFLSAPARLHLLSVAHPSQIRARTLHILAQYGISFGAVWPPFSHVHGWLSNMPCPKKREAKNCFQRWIRNPLLSFAEHRLPLFVCALLVPEYVLAWAIRQYLTARKIARENKGELDTSS